MKDTWASRDRLVLDAAVVLVNEMYPASRYPEGMPSPPVRDWTSSR